MHYPEPAIEKIDAALRIDFRRNDEPEKEFVALAPTAPKFARMDYLIAIVWYCRVLNSTNCL